MYKTTNSEKLEVVDLHKEYEGQSLLNGVNFQVNEGETLCLLGSSGSGKSTILRIIAGIEKPDKGLVLWNGKDLSAVPAYQRNFGLMFQDYALFPHLSVAENVAFGLRMRRMSKTVIEDRVNEALKRVDMAEFGDRRVTDLSGGEQQRIALARALAPRPGLIMLDEPLAALDHSLRVELQDELRTLLHQSEIPAIYVTHDQEEAIVVSDRLALLNEGRIVQCDRTENVFHYPSNRWAAGFLGMSNFLPGTVISIDPFKVHTECGILFPSGLSRKPEMHPGDSLTLLIKPTGVHLTADQDATNRIDGYVEESNFRGDHYCLKVRICGETVFEFSSSSAAVVGQKLPIYLSAEDVIALAD